MSALLCNDRAHPTVHRIIGCSIVPDQLLFEEGQVQWWHKGKEYTLTGSEALTHHDVARGISEVSGRTISYAAISDSEMRSALAGQGMPAASVDYMMKLFDAMRSGHTAGITRDIETVLGRSPRTFSSFAQENAPAWRA